MAQKVQSLAAAGMANLSSEPYVKYDAEGVEPKIPNEAEQQNELFDIIRRTQEHNFSMHRHAMRGTHVKTQAIVKGQLTINSDLPEHLAQGLASPANAQSPHPVAIRFANEPSFLQDDRAPGPRGCGMKIFNVSGNYLDPIGSRTQTQDLTFNNAPLLELRDLKTTVEIFTIRERHFREPEKIKPELEKRSDASLQKAPMGLPNQHFLSYTMYSQAAYRWGPYVVKYALFPTGEYQAALEKSHKITDSSSPEQHSQWLKEWFRDGKQDATYDLRVQLCQSLSAQPVEDASVPWDETAFPFQTVGQVVLPAGQDPFAAERRAFWDDHMKLNVWYGLEEHRPLGSVNRLRKELYQRSSGFRSHMNDADLKEVSSIDQIP